MWANEEPEVLLCAHREVARQLLESLSADEGASCALSGRWGNLQQKLLAAKTSEEVLRLQLETLELLGQGKRQTLPASTLTRWLVEALNAASRAKQDSRPVGDYPLHSASFQAPSLSCSPAAGDIDALTGFPTRAAAEAILRDALANGERPIVAVVVIDRMPLFRARYGTAGANQLTLLLCQELGQSLPEHCQQIFRWTDDSFVLVWTLGDQLEVARRELVRLIYIKRPFELVRRDRTVLVNVTVSFDVLQLWGEAKHALAQIDGYVQRQLSGVRAGGRR